MEKISVTFAQVVEVTQRLADANPEHVYRAPEHMEGLGPRCYYVHTNEDVAKTPRSAGCIVGAVLNELGVPLESLQQCEGSPAWLPVETFLEFPDGERTQAQDFLGFAQVRQDEGTSWGNAVAGARIFANAPSGALV